MGILKGALTARRYHVMGTIPQGYQGIFTDKLNQFAFQEPLSAVKKDEVAGWVQIHNLLDNNFNDLNLWMYNQYALFSIRSDKKSLPAKYFRAHLEQRMKAWCEQNARERCPRGIKEQLKEELEFDLLQKTLPRVSLVDVCWNLSDGWLLFHSQSEAANDRFRKLFQQTFELILQPWTPLDWPRGPAVTVERILQVASSPLEVEEA